MILIGSVIDLNFIAAVDRHPRLGRFLWDSNEHPGVAAPWIAITNPNHHVAERLAGVPQQPHTTFRFERAVLDNKLALADMFPPGKIPSIEKGPPRISRYIGTPRYQNSNGQDRG